MRRPARASCMVPGRLDSSRECGSDALPRPAFEAPPPARALSSSAATIGAASAAVSLPSETSLSRASSSPDIALPPRPLEALGRLIHADLASLQRLENGQLLVLG